MKINTYVLKVDKESFVYKVDIAKIRTGTRMFDLNVLVLSFRPRAQSSMST